jgi:membrane-associated phospholipid phosphatase
VTGRVESGSRLPGYNRWAAVIPVSLAVAVGSLIFFAWLSEEMRERATDRFDSAVRFAIHQHASPWLTALLSRITHLGDWPVILAGTCLLLLVCWYRKQQGLLFLVLVTMAGAGILDGTLKLAFHRPRPDPFIGPKPDTWSFPSGHALVSLCFYGLIAGILSLRANHRWERAIIWTGASLLVAAIGLSRVYLGVHWPSDVAAGYAAGLIWMGAVRVLAGITAGRAAARSS